MPFKLVSSTIAALLSAVSPVDGSFRDADTKPTKREIEEVDKAVDVATPVRLSEKTTVRVYSSVVKDGRRHISGSFFKTSWHPGKAIDPNIPLGWAPRRYKVKNKIVPAIITAVRSEECHHINFLYDLQSRKLRSLWCS